MIGQVDEMSDGLFAEVITAHCSRIKSYFKDGRKKMYIDLMWRETGSIVLSTIQKFPEKDSQCCARDAAKHNCCLRETVAVMMSVMMGVLTIVEH